MHPEHAVDSDHERSPQRRFGEPPVVYLAEDDDDIRELLTAILSHDGFEVRAAPDGNLLFDWLFRQRGPGMHLPDVIVTDHRMPGYCALDILESLSEVQCDIPVIVITAYGSEVRSLALAHGAHEVLEKPFEPDELRLAVMACVDWDSRRRERESDEPIESALRTMVRHAMRATTAGHGGRGGS